MSNERLTSLIDAVASEFLFLENRRIDIPTAGTMLNRLDAIKEEGNVLGIEALCRAVSGLTILLEKSVLDEIGDIEASFAACEKGITIMQEIAQAHKNSFEYHGNIEEFLESIYLLVGERPKNEEPNSPKDNLKEKGREITPEAVNFQIMDESLLKDFIAEGLEYISEIEINILNLEQDPENKDYVNAIFRPFHSIKGVASFLNLEKIRDLSHNLETLLDKVRNNEISVNSKMIDVILDGADTLKAMIGDIRNRIEGKETSEFDMDISPLIKKITNIQQGVKDDVPIKKIGTILVEDGVISEDILASALETVQTKREKKIGEVLIAEGKATTKQISHALRKQASQISEASSVRVDTKKLDDLIDMIGELVITQTMIRQNPVVLENRERNLIRDISQLASITSELQRTSTSLRMIPIKQTFQRMSRLVRDLSRAAGKTVNIELIGEDTEIDRNMVEEIYNPLVHLIRNAVDHGIEAPDQRIKAGKCEAGLIRLKAHHKGGNILIEISDDGRGLNKEKIVEKALKNGIIETDSGLTDQDIYRFIFHPGLSTAEKITDVSGRGVGMDVVKQAVDKLRGKIEIISQKGKGTTFITSFPLTLAIIDGMIVRVGKERYILPTTAIRKLLRPEKELCSSVIGKGEIVNVMGNLLPLVRLHELFKIKSDYTNPWEATLVVIDGEGRSKCLMVDEIIGQEEVVIKGLSEGLKKVKGVSGGAILGNGNIGLILDPGGVFELSEMQ